MIAPPPAGRKVRASQGRMQVNGLTGQPDGKCHRDAPSYDRAPGLNDRASPMVTLGVKRGKPHLTQDQVGGPMR